MVGLGRFGNAKGRCITIHCSGEKPLGASTTVKLKRTCLLEFRAQSFTSFIHEDLICVYYFFLSIQTLVVKTFSKGMP